MPLRIRPLVLSLALSLAAASAAPAAPTGAAMAPADRALQALYWEGHDALQKADWNLAIERFRALEQRLRAAEPQSTDAALYWQAYALAQANRAAEARTAVERLQREFPDSRWKADAAALVRGSARGAAPAAAAAPALAADTELAEAALEGLLSAPPERALPLLLKVLASKHPDKLKKRALFVLSQLDSDAALQAVRETATSGSPELRREAVQMLGISGSPAALDELDAIYAAQPALREQVLRAWLVADAEQRVLAAARTESDQELRIEAVQLLGAMGADEALQALYADSRDARVRRAVIQAYGVSGAVAPLEKAAASDPDPEVREQALHALGVAGAGASLLRLYRSSGDEDMRSAALQGLLVSGDSNAVLEIYRGAKDTSEKAAALRILTLMDDDAAIDAIEAALQ